jgi:hypothetical protein
MRAPQDRKEILVLRVIQARLDRRVSKDLKVIKVILVSLEQIWKYIFAV